MIQAKVEDGEPDAQRLQVTIKAVEQERQHTDILHAQPRRIEIQWVYILKIEHWAYGDLQDVDTPDIYKDLDVANSAVRRHYEMICSDIQKEPDFDSEEHKRDGTLYLNIVANELDGEDIWAFSLQKKVLQNRSL